LTVYDMVKAVTKDARLTDVQLEAKAGGRSGAYARTPGASVT
jgi:cyclic pyranopterin phosphate synthase